MKLSEIVASYVAHNVGSLLDDETVGKHLMRAVRAYAGYATISALPLATDGIHSAVPVDDVVDANDFDLNPSELAIVQPLFKLYCEYDNAVMLEASRGLGVDAFGRTTSEITANIQEAEANLPMAAFAMPPELI